MRTWVALLRGINLGRVNKISMPTLRSALADAGFENVRTYVQSGNVVLDSPLASAARVSAAVRQVVAGQFDVDVPVAVRTGRQLAAVLAWNPFPEAARDRPQLVGVLHLLASPPAAKVRELLARDLAPVRVAARGDEVVVAWHEHTGDRRTEQAIAALGVDGTARNWRTLTALVELTGSG